MKNDHRTHTVNCPVNIIRSHQLSSNGSVTNKTWSSIQLTGSVNQPKQWPAG